MLIKDINIKSLVSGDKSARITLETLKPEDIPILAELSNKMEIEVLFIDKLKQLDHICGSESVCRICHPEIIDKQDKKV